MVQLVVAIAGVCVLLAIAAVVAYRWAKALESLRRGLVALGEEGRARPTLARVSGPVGRLVRLFDVVAPQLDERIARLEQDRQQLRAVLSGMAEAVIAIDARSRLIFANASADQLFGLGPSSVGRLVPELIRSPQVQQAVESTLSGAEPFLGEISMAAREPASGPDACALCSRHALTRLAGCRRGACLPRCYRLETPRTHAARLRRQRLPRVEDPPRLDQGIHRDTPEWSSP